MRLLHAILSFQSVIIYLDTFNFCCARQYVMKVPILLWTNESAGEHLLGISDECEMGEQDQVISSCQHQGQINI